MRETKTAELFSQLVGTLLCAVVSFAPLTSAQTTGTHLGQVDFPTSCSTEAQPLIEKALALLHSFQYMQARQTFEQAQAAETECAMAHWGKAMSRYEQIKEGHKEIELAQALHPATPREQGFLSTAAAFYQENSELSHTDRIDVGEAEAWLAFAEGQTEPALTELRAAAAHQEKNGGESVIIPAREMLADMLAELRRPADALVEYRIVLSNAPNRFDALLGAGRAAQATGDTSGAQSFYAKLTQICPAGADRPELAEAKTVLVKR